jgi:fucose permease
MSEGIAAEWSAVYLRESVGATAAVAASAVVAFSSGMTIARFAGDRLADRLGSGTVVRIGPTVGGVALAVAIGMAEVPATIVALVVLGLGLGPAVPLAFSAAARVRWSDRTALPLAVTAGYTGSIVGPLLVGVTAELTSLRIAFAIPVAMCIVIAVAAPSTDRPR